MSKCSLLQVSLLLGVICYYACRAQQCDMSAVPGVPDLNMGLFTKGYWHVKAIIARNVEDVEEAKYECYVQATSYYTGFYWVGETWRDVGTGEHWEDDGWATPEPSNYALWPVSWFETWLYMGVWVRTDYENYAVQYYCPEESPKHPKSIIIFTRNPTQDSVMLDLLEIIAEGYGFPKENSVRINNTGCSINPEKYAELRKQMN